MPGAKQYVCLASILFFFVPGCWGQQTPPQNPYSLHSDALQLSTSEAGLFGEDGRIDERLDRIVAEVTTRWRHHIAEVAESNTAAAWKLHAATDRQRRATNDLPGEQWHSYVHNTGVGNREELVLHGLRGAGAINVIGPALDSPPLWKVLEVDGVFFLFGVYSFDGITRLHVVKTDMNQLLVQRTAEFSGTNLLVTPYLVRSAHARRQLFIFVKRSSSAVNEQQTEQPDHADKILCYTVDQTTLHTRDACIPVSVPDLHSIGDLRVSTLIDPVTGQQHVIVIPLQASRVLLVYRLTQLPYEDMYTLGVHASIVNEETVWRVGVFTVAARSYLVAAFGTGSQDEMVQVFRYNTGSFSLIQTISVSSYVIDIQTFHIGFQWYLALAQYDRASLYVWHVDEFQLLQSDPSQLAYKWIPIPVKSCRHELVLAKVYSAGAVDNFQPKHTHFYVHNVTTGRFDVVGDVPCRSADGGLVGRGLECFSPSAPDEDMLDLSHMIGLYSDNQTYIIIPSLRRQLVVIEVDASVVRTTDPVRTEIRKIEQHKLKLQTGIEAALRKLQRVEETLADAVVPGGHQILSGDVNIIGGIRAASLSAPSASIGSIRLPGLAGDIGPMIGPISQLADRVNQLQLIAEQLQLRLQDVVLKGQSVHISGYKRFLGSVSADTVYSLGPTDIQRVEQQPLTDILTNIVTSDSSRLIAGTKTFRGDHVAVSGDLHVARVNGRPVSDIVTSSHVQQIVGSVQYERGLQADALTVNGALADVRPDQLVLYNTSSNDPLHVPVVVGTLNASSLVVDLFNGRQPGKMFSSVLMRSGGVFKEPVSFTDFLVQQGLHVDGSLNGVDAAGLLSSVVLTNWPAHLATLRVGGATIAGPLEAALVNSEQFPGSRYLINSGTDHQTSLTQKHFLQLQAGRVVTDVVDGLQLDQLVTLDTSQRLNMLQVLSANFTADLTVLGSIDGVAVGRDLLDEAFNNVTQQVLYVDSLVFDGDVHVRGDVATSRLNGGSLEAAFSNLVPVSDGLNDVLVVNGSITFEQPLSADSLTTTATINGVQPADYLTLNTDQVVSGPVHFAQNVWFLNAHSFGLMDGVNITELAANAIYTNRSRAQLVVAGKRFTDTVQFVNLTVNGAINDQTADEVVWTDTDQLIDGVHGYLGGGVQADSLHVAGGVSLPDGVKMAGLDLSELAAALQDPQTGADVNFTMQLRLHQVDILGSVTVDRINGQPALQLLHKLLGVGTPVVTGRWRFDALQVTGAISTQLGINGGPHLSQLVNSSVSLTSGVQLLGPLHFSTLLVDAGAGISGPLTLSSVPWPVILGRLVHNSQAVVAINATKTFLSGVSVRDSLLSTVLPLHRLLRTDITHNITADVTLAQNASLTVIGDVTLRSAVNYLYDVNSINQTFVTGSRSVINGDLTLTGPVSVSWMHVHGLVSGHNLTATLRDVIRLDSDVRVNAGLRLSGDVRTPTVFLQGGLLNGRPLDQFLSTVRRTDADSHVFHVPVYLPSAVMGHVRAARVHVVGLMNSRNITQLLQDVMLLNGDLTSQQSWTVEELLVTGHMFVHRLNGVRPEGLLVLDGSVPLSLLHVVGDVFVENVQMAVGGAGGRVNEHRLDELLSSLLQLSGDSVVLTEDVSFFGRVFLSGNVSLTGRLNGINISQLLPLSTGGTITGSYQFQNGITADHLHVQSYIDGTDIVECAQSAIYSDQDSILYGQYQLVNISTHIADDGFLQQANGTVSLQLEDCQRLFNQFNDNYTRQCDDMRQLHSDTTGSMYRALRHFKLVQRVSWSPKQRVLSVAVIEPLEGVVATAHVLVTLVGAAGSSCDAGDTRLLRWHSRSARLRRVGHVADGAGAVSDWVQLTTPTSDGNHGNSQLLLVSAASTRSSHTLPQCSSHALSSVWRWQNGGLLRVQNLSVEAGQAVAVPELDTVYLVDPVQGQYHEFVYHSGTGRFVPIPPGTHDAAPDAHFTELLAVHALADGSRLVVTADGSTVSVIHRVGYRGQHTTRLGTLTASSLHTFRLRGRDMLAVADAGWSSLRSRPQGVKIFEYTSDRQHRCIPVQHLDAVEPSSVSHFTAGSLPDVFLLVVERMHGVRIFIDRGEAGFGEFARLSVPGAVWARALRVSSRSAPYLLVSAGDRLVLFRAHLVGTRSVDLIHTADCRPRVASPRFVTS